MLNNIEQRTQVPKSYFVLGGVALLALLHGINAFAAPVSNLVGWALPAFFSFKALESPGVQDDVQWLTYWVVFGFFNFLESMALRVVLYYVPWYFAFKTIFILWLQLPAFRVSVFVISNPLSYPNVSCNLGCSSCLRQRSEARPYQPWPKEQGCVVSRTCHLGSFYLRVVKHCVRGSKW